MLYSLFLTMATATTLCSLSLTTSRFSSTLSTPTQGDTCYCATFASSTPDDLLHQQPTTNTTPLTYWTSTIPNVTTYSLTRSLFGYTYHRQPTLRPGLHTIVPPLGPPTTPPPASQTPVDFWNTFPQEWQTSNTICDAQGYTVVGREGGQGLTPGADGWTVCQWLRPLAGLNSFFDTDRRVAGFDRFPLWSQSRLPGRSVLVELDEALAPRVEVWSSDTDGLVVPAADGEPLPPLPAGSFSHLCTRFGTGQLSLLVNGTVVGSTDVPPSFVLQASSAPFLLGRYTPTSSYDRCFLGEIASLTAHSVALSTSVLSAIAAKGPFTSDEAPAVPAEVDPDQCGGPAELTAACRAQCSRLLDSTLGSCVCLEGGLALADCARLVNDPAAPASTGGSSGSGNIILALVAILACLLIVGVYSYIRSRKAPYQHLAAGSGTAGTLGQSGSTSDRHTHSSRGKNNSNYGRIEMMEISDGTYGVAPNLSTGTASSSVYQAADDVKRGSKTSVPVYDSVVDQPAAGGSSQYSEAPAALYGTGPPSRATAVANYSSADDAKARQSGGVGTMELE